MTKMTMSSTLLGQYSLLLALCATVFATDMPADTLAELDNVLNKLSEVLHIQNGDTEVDKRYAGMRCRNGMVYCGPKSRICIYKWQFCNGRRDCPGSVDEVYDETGAKCSRKRELEIEPRSRPKKAHPDDGLWQVLANLDKDCKGDEVHCGGSSGKCISRDFLCDGYVDCHVDQWDERKDVCADYTCPEGMSRCNSTGRCIHTADLCDGVPHCSQYEDENTLLCGVARCSGSHSLCRRSNICVEDALWCDGYKDCLYGEDEDPESCQSVPCDGLRCSGVCVSMEKHCDGFPDCVDGSDETLERCGPVRCPADTFQCQGYNACITAARMCDGVRDCPDGADEMPNICKDRNLESEDTYRSRPSRVEERLHLAKLLGIN